VGVVAFIAKFWELAGKFLEVGVRCYLLIGGILARKRGWTVIGQRVVG